MTTWNPSDPPDPYGPPPQQPPPDPYGPPPQQPPAGPYPPPPPVYGAQPPASPPPPAYGMPPQQPYGGYPAAPMQPPPGGYGYPSATAPLPPGAVRPLEMGNRVVAFIIDTAILGIPLGILYAIAGAIFISSTKTTCDFNGICHTTGGGGAAAVVLLIGLVALAAGIYFIYLAGTTGQTPGKKIMGVKIVDVNTGQPIGFARALGRYLLQGLCNYVCLAGLWSAFLDSASGRYQGWHDKALNSQVISVK